jgi:hypothetical protein
MSPSAGLDEAAIKNVLSKALRAPSAHNAQPWRLAPDGTDGFRVWYAYEDKLRADPDDRDGLLAVGGFVETLRLVADAAGLALRLDVDIGHRPYGIDIGRITFDQRRGDPDPLAESIAQRQCNRHPYDGRALPSGLAEALRSMGHELLAPRDIAGLVSQASVMSWRDRRFVSDLADWTRFDDQSPDGMTFDCLRLNQLDVVALRVALALKRLPPPLAWIYAQRDVRLTRASSVMAVLLAPDRTPETLVGLGQTLIRSWTLVNSLGYAWHPMSVVIDQPTVDRLRELVGGRDPIAIYRVGWTDKPAAWSHRRALESILVGPPSRER